MSNRNNQTGFSLVEIAIVLVIIGLLLGGVLKGQEMMNSARVRSLADLSSSVQAAYFGFLDRYHAVPGDWSAADASEALGVPVTGEGNFNGRIDDVGGAPWTEPNAAWEHLSKAGFVPGGYLGTPGEPDAGNNLAPTNDFGGVVTLGVTPDYQDVVAPATAKLNIVLGRGVPAKLLLELDTKMDDGLPESGAMRAAAKDSSGPVFGGSHNWGGMADACVAASAATGGTIWGVGTDEQDCNGVVIF